MTIFRAAPATPWKTNPTPFTDRSRDGNRISPERRITNG
ncbi:hypothetical protein APASM_4769 [Actinosynnema pretiosum subsp. pretiosum]|nr:hypothetical protein APASM_4769 [Actinosynnema pretiosum subsp. pretiosum]